MYEPNPYQHSKDVKSYEDTFLEPIDQGLRAVDHVASQNHVRNDVGIVLFLQGCIELITKEAFKVEYQPRAILDAINNEGKTALHILASSAQKVGEGFY